MINPNLLTDSLAWRVAEEAVCACCHEAVHETLGLEIAQAVHAALKEQEAPEEKNVFPHDEIFGALFKSLAPHEMQMRHAVERVWDWERRTVVANVRKLRKEWLGKSKTEDTAESVLFPESTAVAKYTDTTTGLFTTVIDERGQQELDRLEIDVFFDVQNPRVKKWLETYVPRFSRKLAKVDKEKLMAALVEGLEAGEGVPQLIKRVNECYKGWTKYRSESIARSEMLRASNRGALEAYRQSGIVEQKIWITHFGPATCAWCEEMDGKIISLDETYFDKNDDFTIEGEKGEQTMHLTYESVEAPPLHTRCRCTVAAYFEEKGMLFVYGFWVKWEVKEAKRRQADILKNFAKKISNQKNMPPEYQKLASEHFWDLV